MRDAGRLSEEVGHSHRMGTNLQSVGCSMQRLRGCGAHLRHVRAGRQSGSGQ